MSFPCSAAPRLRVLSGEADAAGGCPSDERDEEVWHRSLVLFLRRSPQQSSLSIVPARHVRSAHTRSVTRLPIQF